MFLAWVWTHIKKVESFCFTWGGLKIQDPSIQHVEGVVYLHYLKTQVGRYFNQQRRSPMPHPLEVAKHIM